MSLRDLETEFSLLRDWLFDSALPLWAGRGTDPATGGFYEKLTPAGEPLDEPRRARVTARQVYVFATAGQLGWSDSGRMLDYALANLFRHHLPAEGIVVASVAADGRVLRRDFDLYDHAFVLFALAEASRARGGDAALEARARALLASMQAGWAHPEGGFEEAQPRSLPLKANPHMHLLEAFLAWEALSADPAWRAMSDMIAEMGLARFIDPATGALREYFDAAWQAMPAPPLDVVEPGHQFEWAWLLHRWGTLRGREDAHAAARKLSAIGEGAGVDPSQDLAVNELNADLSLRDGLFRLWPQTERLKAHAIAMARAPEGPAREAAAALACRAARGLRRHLAHPVPGAWWEHLGRDGLPHDLTEPARASSLYHIICAIAETRAQLDLAQG